MTQCFARSAAACAWFLSVVSCADAHPRGLGEEVDPQPPPAEPTTSGQPGGEAQMACNQVDQPPSAAVVDGVLIQNVWDEIERLLRAGPALQWWPKVRQRDPIPETQLRVTALHFGETVTTGCQTISTTIEFDVSSEDGQLEGHFTGTLSGYTSGELDLRLTAALTEGKLQAGLVRAGLSDDAPITLSLHWRASVPESLSGTVDAEDTMIAWINPAEAQRWYPTDARPEDISPVVRGELQQRACEGLSMTAPATFASDEALRQTLAKRWIVCSGETNLANIAGFEIDGSGHWRELNLIDGELVAAQGFGHEGEIVRNVFGSDFNLAILDWLPDRYSFYTASLSADGSTLRLDGQMVSNVLNATFKATDLPVRHPPTAFEAGSRAGRAACSTSPVNLTTRPASISALRELLIGDWAFCSGRFGTKHAGVTFDANGTFRYLEADGGKSAEPGTYEIIDSSEANGPGAFQIDLRANGNWYPLSMPMFANSPRMWRANDERDSVLSAL